MIVGALGKDVFKVIIQRYAGDSTVTIDVDVCMARSAVKKKTVEGDVIIEKMNWVPDSG